MVGFPRGDQEIIELPGLGWTQNGIRETVLENSQAVIQGIRNVEVF